MSEVIFDNDKALLITNQLKAADVDYRWAVKNPLWFLAVRDEDIPIIHDKFWVGKRGTSFAQYANALMQTEHKLCEAQTASNKHIKMLVDSTDARTKFYRYYLAILFTPGLRLIDVEKHKMYCWSSSYFTKTKFKTLFETSIDSRKVREFSLLQPIGDTEKTRLLNLVNNDILNQVIVDKQLLKSSACKPLKFVYGVNWKEEDRLISKSHYKTL